MRSTSPSPFAISASGKYNWAVMVKLSMLKTSYLSLGANLGDRVEKMREAVRLIGDFCGCEISAVSPLYRTQPVGLKNQPDFLNAVIEVKTTLNPNELLKNCQELENRLGRKRTIRWGPRVIDIDILLYESVEINDESLIIPHPRMMERAFVLVPLAEIAPNLVLPSGDLASAVAETVDKSGIEQVQDGAWSR